MYPDVPFVDREEAFSYLRETRDEAETRVHVICGQSGIGKSELAREFADSCDEGGHPTLFYQIGDPRNEKVFLQRLLGAWYEKHPESTATQLKEYLFSPDSVDDFLGLIERTVPDPASNLGVRGLRKAVSGIAGTGANFPDPVQLITDVMKGHGSPEFPAVVVVDDYETETQDGEAGLESTFRDVARHLDESVVWYITANTEIRGGKRVECFHLKPFDQDTPTNPGASYPEDSGLVRSTGTNSDRGYAATRALVEEAGLEYQEPDLVDLHDRTKGVPLLVASICADPESFSLGEELDSKPTSYAEFRNRIQRDFVHDLTERQLEILEKTSTIPVITSHICSERTGIAQVKIHQDLSELARQGKIMELPPNYPASPAYRCHDFYREFLIQCADLEERELRLETAIDCLEVAFDNVQMDRDPEVDDVIALQLDRFMHQVSKMQGSRMLPEIAELVVKGSTRPENEIEELFALYVGAGHREDTLEDYLRALL
jgi:hypothetical protein